MPGRRLMFAALSLVLALAGVSGMKGEEPEAASVGMPEVSPKFVLLDDKKPTKVTVTVTARIGKPKDVIPGKVELQQVDSKGNFIKTLGPMNDDGAGGDLKKGDGVYTIVYDQLELTKTDNPVYLRVSATYNGMKPAECGIEPVTGVPKVLSRAPTPEEIKTLLQDKNINNASAFLQRLNPADKSLKHDWIMITSSLSAQRADGKHPRLLLQNSDATAVFGVQQVVDKEGKEDIIEYIQWDSAKNRFRFHEIDTKNGKITPDDASCYACHSGPKDPPPTLRPWPYPRPNWDAYDNWGGALPFNRDRVYIGSVEQKAMERLLKKPSTDPVMAQLDLPEGMTRQCDGSVVTTPDPVQDEDPKTEIGNDAGIGTGKIDVDYTSLDADNKECTDPPVSLEFPDKAACTEMGVQQGGKYLTMHSLAKGLTKDEGRGVALFDNLTALNAARIAEELKNKLAEEANVVDLRPVALAIAGGGTDAPCIDDTNLKDFAPDAAIKAFNAFLGVKDFNALTVETLGLRHQLPQIKADQEAETILTMIGDNGDGVTRRGIVEQVALRSAYGPPSQTKPFNLDVDHTKFMIDREIYNVNPDDPDKVDINLKISLFRYFLEPSREPVRKWSLSISSINSGVDRAAKYDFADVFPVYLNKIKEVLNAQEFGNSKGGNKGLGQNKSCADLKADSSDWFNTAITNNPDYFKQKK